ncbi:MAG TPA: hypothetical protein VF135_13270 [Terriglobales bacterium]
MNTLFVRALFVVSVSAQCLVAFAQQPSLADQARALRETHAKATRTDFLGRTVGDIYRNDRFSFEIHRIPGWTSMDRGMMNVNEAVGREALGMRAGVSGDITGRVFGMQDERGSSLIVAINPVPGGTGSIDPELLKKVLAAQLKNSIPSAEFFDEPVVLGDSIHQFTALRLTQKVGEQTLYQSTQLIPLEGYVLNLTVSAPSAERLTQALQQLQPRLIWKAR